MQLGEMTWATPVFQGVQQPQACGESSIIKWVWSSPSKGTGKETERGEATVGDTHSFTPDSAPTVPGVAVCPYHG